MPTLQLKAVGNLYLRVPTKACPPTAADLAAALPAATLVAPAGKPGVSFSNATIGSAVTNAQNGKSIADWKLAGLQLGFTGATPIGAAPAPACTQLTFLNGSLSLDSSIVGPRTASLETVSQNHTMTASAAVDAGGKAATVTLKNATFVFDIAPGRTPGVASTAMHYEAKGDLVATATLADKAAFIEAAPDSFDWNAKRRLWQPTVVAPCEKDGLLPCEPEPDAAVVPAEGAPGSCQVDAAAAAKAAAATSSKEGGAAAAAASSAGRGARLTAAATAVAAVAAAAVAAL